MHVFLYGHPPMVGVAFELKGIVEEPHDILRSRTRWYQQDGLYGWAHGRLSAGDHIWRDGHSGRNAKSLGTLLWLAQSLPKSLIRVPPLESIGLGDSPLHKAVKLVVLAQAVYRAVQDVQELRSILNLPPVLISAPEVIEDGQQQSVEGNEAGGEAHEA